MGKHDIRNLERNLLKLTGEKLALNEILCDQDSYSEMIIEMLDDPIITKPLFDSDNVEGWQSLFNLVEMARSDEDVSFCIDDDGMPSIQVGEHELTEVEDIGIFVQALREWVS